MVEMFGLDSYGSEQGPVGAILNMVANLQLP